MEELRDAKNARTIAAQELWELIIREVNDAMKEGRFKCYVDRKLPNDLKRMILNKGYTVSISGQGFMIFWGDDGEDE